MKDTYRLGSFGVPTAADLVIQIFTAKDTSDIRMSKNGEEIWATDLNHLKAKAMFESLKHAAMVDDTFVYLRRLMQG